MEYKEIVSVTGLGGLYQLVTTKSDGAIVRNVADKTTKFISARQHNVTPLESIEVYTTGDNVRLHEVFRKMQEHEETIPLADSKSADSNTIKGYFKSIFPEFDEERVYVSDMKKMLKWYELLKATDLLHFDEEPAETTDAEDTSATTDSKPDELPAETTEIPAFEVETTDITGNEDVPTDDDGSEATTEIGEVADDETPAEGDEKPTKRAPRKKKTEE